MKKINLAVVILFAGITLVMAQPRSQRLVLAEEHTGAWWPSCASTNPAFYALINANIGTKIACISYAYNDVMQVPDGIIRKTYYSVPYYPIAYKDGNLNGLNTVAPAYPGWLPNWTQAVINAQYLIPSPFTISLTWNFTPANDSVAVRIVVTATEPVTMTTPKLQVAMIERLIHFSSPPGSNGETDFENVCRKMYPDGNGTTIPTTWTTNQQQIYNFKEKIPTVVYSKTQIAFVAFIQDNSTKDVKQNSYSGPQALNSVPNIQANDDFNILVYPNPMNTNGVVSFYLDKAAMVSFEIIDLLGKTVIIEQTFKEAGVSNIPVNSTELSNGIYTIKIGVNGKIFTRKLIISR